jgi:two-component system, chemotaxis family, protein-glutamate methylesterase/glutaminase
MNSHYLYPGNFAAFKEETIISTLLGSCVAVALFDPETKIGGLNHYLLPSPSSYDKPSPRYGTIAIEELISEMKKLGAKPSRLQAKIYGGGNVITNVLNGPSIGSLNIALAEKVLKSLNIPIVEKNVAGNKARTIKVNSATFEVIHNIAEDDKVA